MLSLTVYWLLHNLYRLDLTTYLHLTTTSPMHVLKVTVTLVCSTGKFSTTHNVINWYSWRLFSAWPGFWRCFYILALHMDDKDLWPRKASNICFLIGMFNILQYSAGQLAQNLAACWVSAPTGLSGYSLEFGANLDILQQASGFNG